MIYAYKTQDIASFKTMKLRAYSLKHGAIRTIIKHEEDIMVLHNATKFQKF